ncbi:MAG: DUF4012 domain-containing protein [bacterium]|nr:DUF4012 domain-containing protein [bacterium]
MDNFSPTIPKIDLRENAEENSILNPDAETVLTVLTGVPKILWAVVGAFLFIIVYFAATGFTIYQKGNKLASSVKKLQEEAGTQDLKIINAGVDRVRTDLGKLKSSYSLISWAGFVPYFGGYINDGKHAINASGFALDTAKTVIVAVEPYSDLLGLKGTASTETPESGEKTAQERIDFLVKTIPSLIPQIDKISGNAAKIQEEVSQINPDRYPEKYKGQEVQSKIRKAQNLVDEMATVIVNGKPMLENTPYLLGMDTPRNYLVLFQNDKELRPTGGFMTGYSIMKVDKAKFSPTTSDDIYNLDARYKPSTPAPDPIVKYIKGPYVISKNLRFRDMNWSPDFSVSMADVTKAGREVGIDGIDGIIAVDTQLLVNLLDVIGPIGVPGFGNFSNNIEPKCNCPGVIYELESYADVEGPIIWDPLTGKIILKPKNSDNRKKIIGPLMNSVMANAMGQPKEKLAPLFEAGLTSLMEKHVLLYMMDEKVQLAVSDFGVGGTIDGYQGDYLHINDANLGGRKSNLYTTQEVMQDIVVKKDGSVEKTVTIIYKNPQKYDGWLNSVLPNWVRIYVPKGSELLGAEGLEAKESPYEDLGKTVFAGYFQLRPEGVAKVTFKYKLPMKMGKVYKLLIQKQPGTDGPLYTINLGKHEEEFLLKTDKEIKIGI